MLLPIGRFGVEINLERPVTTTAALNSRASRTNDLRSAESHNGSYDHGVYFNINDTE